MRTFVYISLDDMARWTSKRLWKLLIAALLLILSVRLLLGGRAAAAHHSVMFMPDRIGGVGDTWMWPGQAYFLSALCGAAALWLLFRFVRDRPS
jgi:hypothetical protein